MARYNFDIQRERKRPVNKGKFVRLAILFCIVAAVTAAVIYAIVPRSAPEGKAAAAEKTPVPEVSTPSESGSGSVSSDSGETGVAGATAAAGENQGQEAASEPDAGENASAGENTAAEGNIPVGTKYAPSDKELTGYTAGIRTALEDGSWKKQRDVVVHKVVAGDSLEKLARKYNTTVQFLRKYNKIANVNAIQIDQKIYCWRAERWEITVSRSRGTLQLDRVIGGNAIAFIILPCRISAGSPRTDLMVGNRFAKPVYVDQQGRQFASGSPENPYGEGQLTLIPQGGKSSWLAYSIHGEGNDAAVAGSLKRGSIVLNNEDIKLLYLLVPEKTPVKIIE